MAYSYQEHIGTGTTGPFSYGSVVLLDEDVETVENQLDVFKNGVLLALTTNYTIDKNQKHITLTSPIYSNDRIRIARNTKKDSRYVSYVDGTNITSDLLNLDSNQAFFNIQEALDIKNDAIVLDTDGKWEARSRPIKNVSNGVYGTDAVNVNQLNAAFEGGLPANLQGYGVLVHKGNGDTRTFSLPPEIYNVSSPKDFEVHVGGSRLTPNEDYIVVGTNVVLDASVSTPGSQVDVLITYPRGAVSAILTANSVFTDSLQTKCVTPAKINNGTDGDYLKSDNGVAKWSSIFNADVKDFSDGVTAIRLNQMAIPTANVNINSQRLLNVATPTDTSDGANKSYIDNLLKNVVTVQTWIPTLLENAAPSQGSYYQTSGLFVKIGKLCCIRVEVQITSSPSTGTQVITLHDSSNTIGSSWYNQALSLSMSTPTGMSVSGAPVYASINGSTIYLVKRSSSSASAYTNITKGDFVDGTRFTISGSYISAL